MKNKKLSIIGLLLAIFYWFADSTVHHLLDGENNFEFIPIETNKLWMRIMTAMLFIFFGIYASYSKPEEMKIEGKTRKSKKSEAALTLSLNGFVTICSHCKSVKKEINNWIPIESYVVETDKLSHGLCDKCLKLYYSEILKNS